MMVAGARLNSLDKSGTPLDECGFAWARVNDSINRFCLKASFITYINRHLPEKDTRAPSSSGAPRVEGT